MSGKLTLVFERRVYTSQVNISNENIFSCRKWCRTEYSAANGAALNTVPQMVPHWIQCRKWCRTEYRNMNFKSECLLFLVAWFWNRVSSLFMSPDYSVL